MEATSRDLLLLLLGGLWEDNGAGDEGRPQGCSRLGRRVFGLGRSGWLPVATYSGGGGIFMVVA
jgi:hypothetical protein